MNTTNKNGSSSLIDDLRDVVRDAIDYSASAMGVLQARLTTYALSTILFFLLIVFASLLLIGAFVFFNIAIGVALAHSVGTAWALLILGSFYLLLSIAIGGVALSWAKRLKS
jgi:hypothetical protein